MLAAGVLSCVWVTPAAARTPFVNVVVTPPDTTVQDLAAVPHMAVGLMSTGIGEVPPEQTYLDISQGNRVADELYDRPLPPIRSFLLHVPRWQEILGRAGGAPADIVPGLLASSLGAAGLRSEALPSAEHGRLIMARRDGAVGLDNGGVVTVFGSGIGVVRKAAASMPGDEALIAISEPAAGERTVPIGIAGAGFAGNLTSDSTRTGGYVLSTDIAPTILRRFGLPIPDEMDGQPIRAAGRVDPAAIEDLDARLHAIPGRRAPVVILSLVAWIVVAAIVALLAPALRRSALAWLALSFACMPLTLLAGAAIEPGAVAEGLLVGFGAAGLAAGTLAVARGWWALAIACSITVTAYAIDVIAGSGLTKLSLLGPNPIFGARFYGIGNELEALIAVMVPVAIGAGLTAKGGWGRGAAIGAFLGAGVVAALSFAAGRFGADVGAAIVLPVGAVVAVAALPRESPEGFARPGAHNPSKLGFRRRMLPLLLATPVIAVSLLALTDLVSGGDSHLTHSVLDAGGASNLAEVAQRRLELSAMDFAQAASNPLFWLVIAGICACFVSWRRIDAWLALAPPFRAGFLGACAAVAAGVLVNDSGATFLVLGSLALGASVTFAWAQASNP